MTHFTALGCMLSLVLAGCAAQKTATAPSAAEILFDGTIQEFYPCASGDLFVYRVSRPGAPPILMTERLSITAEGGIVAEIRDPNGKVASSHHRIEGTTLRQLSEALVADDVVIVYDQGLPMVTVPVRTGTEYAASPVTIMRGSTGAILNRGDAEQTIVTRRAAADSGAVVERAFERQLRLSNGILRFEGTTWVQPGVGDVRQESRSQGAAESTRELVCAVVSGRRSGACDTVPAEMLEP